MRTNIKNSRFTLFPDEKVITTTRLHWMNNIMPIFCMLFCFFWLIWRRDNIDVYIMGKSASNALITPEYRHYALLLETIAATVLFIMAALRYVSALLTRYYITDKRVISISGILTVRMSEMLLDRCETVNLSQNILERILGCGDIMIISAGSSLLLNDVPDVNTFRMQIMQSSAEYKRNTN